MSLGKFLTTPIGSALRVLVGVVLGYLVLDLQADGTISVSVSEVWTWVAAGLVIAVPILIAAVNPSDTRFGRTS
jgi:predicted ABC-type sugar transport system permease subunit